MEYKQDLENMLTYLDEGNNIDYLEKLINNYVVANPEHDRIKFLNFRVELFQTLDKYSDVFLYYINQDDYLVYDGQYQSVLKRLEVLKKISRYNILQSDKAVNQPFALKANIVSFNRKTPEEMLLTLINNNSESFETYLDFNGTVNVVSSLIENLNEKYDYGSNTIDASLVDRLKGNFDLFIGRYEEIEKETQIHRNKNA
ncbi:hypothetical protein XJ18_16485 [Bacillus pumilus]|uniref:hypothetical protein n=1 Tax=Bacillus altitudinis TaxID=293387 RepID=UPI000640282D|nr:hypothetical protein [Bacillus altitudinis]KLK98283.1 hypothetical protein XJ18_16485 [Bacillus pumilus]